MTLLLALCACQSGGDRSPVVTPQKMICGLGSPAQITLYSPQIAVLVFEGKSYDLEREESSSGIRYANRSIEFWNKGIDALITRENGSVANCTYIPKSGL